MFSQVVSLNLSYGQIPLITHRARVMRLMLVLRVPSKILSPVKLFIALLTLVRLGQLIGVLGLLMLSLGMGFGKRLGTEIALKHAS